MRARQRVLLPAAIGAALLTTACGGNHGASWNDATKKELGTRLEQMFKDIDSGNFAGLKMWADQDAVLFDFDENNRPVSARGADALDKYLVAYDAAVRKGQKVHTTISKDDCFGDADIGYCVVEYDQTIGASGGPFKFRGTLIAAKEKEGWRWVHWHSSFREFPAPAAASAPTETPAEALSPTETAPAPATSAPAPATTPAAAPAGSPAPGTATTPAPAETPPPKP